MLLWIDLVLATICHLSSHSSPLSQSINSLKVIQMTIIQTAVIFQTIPSKLGIRQSFTRLTAIVCQGLECTTAWKEESSSATLQDCPNISEDDIVRRRPRFAICSRSWISWKKPGESQSNWVVLGVISDPACKLPTGTVCVFWEVSVFNN